MNSNKLLLSAAFGLLLAACGGSETLPGGAAGDGIGAGGAGGAGDDFFTAGVDDQSSSGAFDFEGMQPGDPEILQNDLIVYFEFDSSEIRSDFNAMLAAHGRYLASDPGITVRLEGHADERGSREYNIGLGERRAQAVRQILLLQGATASQLSTVSYGEERPAVFGSDEEAYSLNRRVELVYN